MKAIAPFVLATAMLLANASAAPVMAEPEYAWCAVISTQGGSQSCTFTTIDQCRAYAAGSGFCQPNPRASLATVPGRSQRR